MKLFDKGISPVSSLVLGGVFLAVLCGVAEGAVPGDPLNYSRSRSFTYDAYGELLSTTVEPGHLDNCSVLTYQYGDVYGNRTGQSQSNCTGAPSAAQFLTHSATSSYSPTGSSTVTVAGQSVSEVAGEAVYQTTNALGYAVSATYDPRFGSALSQTDENGLVSTVSVDDFGRTLTETKPDHTAIVHYYCIIAGRGLDTSSNTDGCPSPGASEIPTDAVSFSHSETHDINGAKMGAFVRTYQDRLGRELRTVTESFDGSAEPTSAGSLIATDTTYSIYGVKVLESRPYFLANQSSRTGGSSDYGAVTFNYDVLGRVITVYNADDKGSQSTVNFPGLGARPAAVTITAYNGLSTTVTNDHGQPSTKELDVSGKTLRVTDTNAAQIAYEYDAFGNLIQVVDALQNTITQQFDYLGKRIAMVDPDAGTWNYCYDALGQLSAQQNSTMRQSTTLGSCPGATSTGQAAIAVSQWTTIAYDVLGRQTQRIDPEYTTTWSYDTYADGSTCNKGLGELCQVATSTGVGRKYAYDAYGRQTGVRTDIQNGPSFIAGTGYDTTTGRVASTTYPTGLQVAYAYTPKGFPEKLLLATAATINPLPSQVGGTPAASVTLPVSTVLWQNQSVDAWGNVEQALLGNGITNRKGFDPYRGRPLSVTAGVGSATGILNQSYTWDSLRNLSSRVDANGDGSTGAVTESFGYDAKQRLTSYTVNAPAIPGLSRAVSMDYNAIGNILYKSDVGVYQYGTSGATHPHAVIGITEGPNPDNTLGYDLNGNLISSTSSKYATLAYTSFNLPDSQNGIAGQGGYPKYVWNYDENHARIKEIRTLANGDVRTLWYLNPDNAGGLSFESETNNPASPSASDPALTSNRHYLTVDGAVVGVLVSTGSLPSVGASDMAPPSLGSITLNKAEYWHLDYQNSLTATTDQAGTITERYAYDPFGKRRYTNGSYDAAGNLILDWSDTTSGGSGRGYTGHEQLDDIGLTHMNGRIYDATLGRMLQADPIVSDLENLQHTNRYSYVWNNPFQWTDPTGYAGVGGLGDFCHGGSVCTIDGVDSVWMQQQSAMGNDNGTQKQAASPTGAADKQVTAAVNQNTTKGDGPNAAVQVVRQWAQDSIDGVRSDLNGQGLSHALESLPPAVAGTEEAAAVVTDRLASVVVHGARSSVRAIDAADMAIARSLRSFFATNRVGIPATRSANALSPVLEFDAHGNELVYRTMSEAHFEHLQQTGVLLPTTETSISPALSYSSKYDGITVRFTTAPGTSAELQQIGIAANKPAAAQFPEMSTQTGKWMQDYARFKVEGGQMTTQLGQGRAIDIFNKNIIQFDRVR